MDKNQLLNFHAFHIEYKFVGTKKSSMYSSKQVKLRSVHLKFYNTYRSNHHIKNKNIIIHEMEWQYKLTNIIINKL